MKRGQIHSYVFIYLFILLIVIVILVFGFVMIKKSNKTAETVQLSNIAVSLRNIVQEYNEVEEGSRTARFSLPSGIKKVCIVSEETLTNEFVYQGNGLYLLPDHFYKIEGFNVENGFICGDVNGEVEFQITKRDEVSLSLKESEQECNSVLYNKDNNIDIVFLNHNMDNDNFQAKINEYIGILLSKEPLKSNENYFNFYSVDDPVGCETEGYILCDDVQVKQIASKCPNDFIVILSKHLLDVPRSSSRDRVMAINTADDNLVVLHEFGHAFGKLADEYVVSGLIDINAVNCQSSPEWNNKFLGCSLSNYYRSSEDSLMRSFGPFSENEFNNICKEELLNRVGAYK